LLATSQFRGSIGTGDFLRDGLTLHSRLAGEADTSQYFPAGFAVTPGQVRRGSRRDRWWVAADRIRQELARVRLEHELSRWLIEGLRDPVDDG
jgi:hypothetical protein